jgi:hypothetical protein
MTVLTENLRDVSETLEKALHLSRFHRRLPARGALRGIHHLRICVPCLLNLPFTVGHNVERRKGIYQIIRMHEQFLYHSRKFVCKNMMQFDKQHEGKEILEMASC